MTRRPPLRPFHFALFMAAAIASPAAAAATQTASRDADGCSIDAAPSPGESAFCRGKASFSDRTLAGLGANGRSCADCHVATESFQLTPATAQARFAEDDGDAASDDPLFRAIDADDFRVNGDRRQRLHQPHRERPRPRHHRVAGQRETARLRCDRALPGIGPADERDRRRRLARGALDPRCPNHRPGRPRPGVAPGAERKRRLSARRPHRHLAKPGAGRAAQPCGSGERPSASFLDDLAAFQSAMFSSPAVKLLADGIATGATALPDPDPALDPLEAAGKLVFERACGQCHGNQAGRPSTSVPLLESTPGTPTAHRALSRHPDGLPSPDRHGEPAALLVRAVQREPDEERAHLRDHQQRRCADRHAVRRRPGAATVRDPADDLRSGSAAPHRLPSTGRPGRHPAHGHPEPARPEQDGAVLLEQHGGHARGHAGSLHAVLQARADPERRARRC